VCAPRSMWGERGGWERVGGMVVGVCVCAGLGKRGEKQGE
jgi:hypothetical protein